MPNDELGTPSRRELVPLTQWRPGVKESGTMKAFPVHWPPVIPSLPCCGARSKQSLCNLILVQHQTTTTNKETNGEVKGQKIAGKGNVIQCSCKCRMRHWRLEVCLLSKFNILLFFVFVFVFYWLFVFDWKAVSVCKAVKNNRESNVGRNCNKRFRHPQRYKTTDLWNTWGSQLLTQSIRFQGSHTVKLLE